MLVVVSAAHGGPHRPGRAPAQLREAERPGIGALGLPGAVPRPRRPCEGQRQGAAA